MPKGATTTTYIASTHTIIDLCLELFRWTQNSNPIKMSKIFNADGWAGRERVGWLKQRAGMKQSGSEFETKKKTTSTKCGRKWGYVYVCIQVYLYEVSECLLVCVLLALDCRKWRLRFNDGTVDMSMTLTLALLLATCCASLAGQQADRPTCFGAVWSVWCERHMLLRFICHFSLIYIYVFPKRLELKQVE